MRPPLPGNASDFLLKPHSKPYSGRFARTHGAKLPVIQGFPFNRMKVGQSFFMHKGEVPAYMFMTVRDRVRRCNASGAAWFICEWIDGRSTLEIARIA